MLRQVFNSLFKSKTADTGEVKTIIIVSGVPRCGTSLMMQMLEAGGMAVLTDNFRKADEDNPRGYYEFEPALRLTKGNHNWPENVRGKALKVFNLKLLPQDYKYKVIFMHRRTEEMLTSQQKMRMRWRASRNIISDKRISNLSPLPLRKVISALLQHLPPRYKDKFIFIDRQMANTLAPWRKTLIRWGIFPDKNSDEWRARIILKHLKKVQTWLSAQPNFSVLDVDYNRLVVDPWPYLRQIREFLGNTLDMEKMANVIDPGLYRNRASDINET